MRLDCVLQLASLSKVEQIMETKIQKALRQWFPEAFSNQDSVIGKSDYEMLRQFAAYARLLMESKAENKRDPFKIIQLLYTKGTLYEKNAIENEFLTALSYDESTHTIKEHLELMPDQLKTVYLKTILEN